MLGSKYGAIPDFFGTRPSQLKEKVDDNPMTDKENNDGNGRDRAQEQGKDSAVRSKLEQRLRKSQSAKKVEGEHSKAVNTEEAKLAVAKIEEDLGIVLHSKWAEKKSESKKTHIVSFIKVTQCLINIFVYYVDNREEAHNRSATLGM